MKKKGRRRKGPLVILLALALLVSWILHRTRIDLPLLAFAPTSSVIGAPPIRVSWIQTGHSRAGAWLAYEGGPLFERREIVYGALSVVHPQARLLIDTGLGRRVREQFETQPLWYRKLFDFEFSSSVRDQLEAQGHASAPIDLIVLTHTHWDHASGVEDFPEAQVLATSPEKRFALGTKRPYLHGLIREQFGSPEIKWANLNMENRTYECFDRSLDLFGDGTVVLVSLAGHTPGSVGVFLNLQSGKRYFMIGDATWVKEGFELPAQRNLLPSRLVDSDRSKARDVLGQLAAFHRERPDVIIVPAHDDRVIHNLPQFPRFEQ